MKLMDNSINRTVFQIKMESKKLQKLTDNLLKEKISKIREVLKNKENKKLVHYLVPCFALVQEISYRNIGLKHYDTQLIAGIHLHNGKIIEMKTGEGKTLVSTLPASLNALTQTGVHIITINEYLADRDRKLMEKIYSKLGLTVGFIKTNQQYDEKKINYSKNITYLTNYEIVFDYLRSNTNYDFFNKIEPLLNYCIIDEIDSIFIDESQTPLNLSQTSFISNKSKINFSNNIALFLKERIHFEIDYKNKNIFLTEKGCNYASLLLDISSIYNNKNPWALEIINALKAHFIYKLNKDYVILNNKISIIDIFTGRIVPNIKWGLGLHEAIEAKEKLIIGSLTETQASITYQKFFQFYNKCSGMTGTAIIAKEEFKQIYNLEVIKIKTFKNSIRQDHLDKVYIDKSAKLKNILYTIINSFKKGQPILIGTSNIEKSEFLSKILSSINLPHQVLNARPENAKREVKIVAKAGKLHAITIATKMANRGTDIILGGNIIFDIKKIMKKEFYFFISNNTQCQHIYRKYLLKLIKRDNFDIHNFKNDIRNIACFLNDSTFYLNNLYNISYTNYYPQWIKKNKKIKKLGGLFVLGTERSNSRRIDNQLQGRTGRQGEPGVSKFYLSLNDKLLHLVKEKYNNFFFKSKCKSYIESENITNNIKELQEKLEHFSFQFRKNIFYYEKNFNLQQFFFYKCRKDISKFNSYKLLLLRLNESKKKINKFYYSKLFIKKKKKIELSYKKLWCSLEVYYESFKLYEPNFLSTFFSMKFLEICDCFWSNHIKRLEFVKNIINYRCYGKQIALEEYNIQSEFSSILMYNQITIFILDYILNKQKEFSPFKSYRF